MKHVVDVPKTQIALRLQQAMDKEGLGINDLAKELGQSYEFIRRVSRGINLPSMTSLKLMSQRFGWDFAEMKDLLVKDRFRIRNGPEGAIAQDFNPEVEPFEKGWALLDQTQKDFLLANLNLFLAQNRRATRGGKNKHLEEAVQ